MQEKTKRIIKEDIDAVRAYADVFDVEMPDLDEKGEVIGLPAPYPREVAGVVRSGYRIYELGQTGKARGWPILNPILGRNSAEETYKESCDIYRFAEAQGETIFHFVHAEATRHLDPLKGNELIKQSRGKGGITPKGEREFVQLGGGSKHPIRINATGDTPHLSIINALIAGFDGTDIGPVIHVHFGGRGIHDYKTKVVNGYKAIQICADNNIFVQLDSHKHLVNIGGTDGMALAMCLLSEGLAIHAELPAELSAIQMNLAGINLFADLALVRAFRQCIWSKSIVVVPETFQDPPADLIAEAAHFARMAISAKLGGVEFYRPKAAESVGIPTGESMGHALYGTFDVFKRTYGQEIFHPDIEKRQAEIINETMAILEIVLSKKDLRPELLTPKFWLSIKDDELIDCIVSAGKRGVLDCQRAGGWDLKRHVKVHRGIDGITRYIKGWTPLEVDATRCVTTTEDIAVEVMPPQNRKEKVVLGTVGADAHVNGINVIREAFQRAGYEVIFLRGMNLPETLAEVAAEVGAKVLGASNLLGLGITLFPRISKRLEELGLRQNIIFLAGGRIAEKEEEHAQFDAKIKEEGTGFLGVDKFFGPGTNADDCVAQITELLKQSS